MLLYSLKVDRTEFSCYLQYCVSTSLWQSFSILVLNSAGGVLIENSQEPQASCSAECSRSIVPSIEVKASEIAPPLWLATCPASFSSFGLTATPRPRGAHPTKKRAPQPASSPYSFAPPASGFRPRIATVRITTAKPPMITFWAGWP